VKDKYDFNSVTLIDEEGKELEFEVIDFLLVDEQEYAVLIPFRGKAPGAGINPKKTNGPSGDEVELESEIEGSEEVVIMRIVEYDGEITLLDIDDEDERQKVADIAFEGLFEQEEG
jgi:hypothetical protein